jgi:hypothetical protein
MSTPHLPEIPEIPEVGGPEEKPGNALWHSGKIGLGLAAMFGYFQLPFPLIAIAVLLVTSGEYLRFRFSRNTEVGWGVLGLVLTSTLFCSMLYGAGRLVAHWWPPAP